MKHALIVLLCVFLLNAAACVSTSTIRLGESKPLARTDPGDVKIYLSHQEVPGPYARLALIYAEELTGRPTYGQMVAQMKVKAAKIGANGLILEEMSRKLDINGGCDEPINLDSDKIVKGVAIYVKE